MLVLNVSKCPAGLKGDLTKWLYEIAPGTFVGTVNARVREMLWERVLASLKSGKATLVYSAANEQKLTFRTIGTDWEPVDYDGLTLIRRPSAEKKLNSGVKDKTIRYDVDYPEDYIVLDVETTGLDPVKDNLLEIGALRIRGNTIVDHMAVLIHQNQELSLFTKQFTGITDIEVQNKGIEALEAIQKLIVFIKNDTVVGHNIDFDISFIEQSAFKLGLILNIDRKIDTLQLARKQLPCLPDKKLRTIAEYFSITLPSQHRALADCFITQSVYSKLKEMKDI